LGDLDAIVMMTLRKEPFRRYASVHDVSEDIRKHLEGLPITARPSTIAYRGSKFIRRHTELAVGALIFLFVVLFGGLAVIRHWEVRKPVSGPKEEVVRTQLTADAPGNQVISAAISRDGKYLAYTTSTWKMYLLQIDSRKLRRLPSSDFTPVDWFPDGNHLLVSGRGQHSGLWTMSISDGTSRKLLDSLGFAVALSLDGSHIAYQKASSVPEIWVMNANGEQPHRIAEFDAVDDIKSLAWSPSGQRLVYIHGENSHDLVIETCNVQGGQRTLVLSEPGLWNRGVSDVNWLPDGRILYRLPDPLSYSDFNIWAVATDPGSGRPLSPPGRVTNGAREAANFQASADGKRFTYLSSRSSDAVYLGNLKPGARTFNLRRLTLDQWNNWPADWTRDSKALLFESSRSGRFAILKQRIDQQTAEILLSGAENYRNPVFSPTGNRLLYTTSSTVADPNTSERLTSMPVDGGASSILLAGDYTYHCGSVPSALCVVSEVKGQQFVFSIFDPVEGKGAEIQRVAVHPNAYWSLSPDGTKIAIADDQTIAGEVKILTLAESKVVTLALKGWRWKTVQTVAWSADGGHLLATAYTGTSFVLLFIDLRGNLRVLTEVPWGEAWLYKPVPSPDGHYLAYMKRTYESNVVMLEHF